MRPLRHFFRAVLLVLIIAGALLFDGYRQLHAPLAKVEPGATLVLVPGETLSGVLVDIGQRGWLPSARAASYLKLYVRWHGVGARIRSGEYAINDQMTLIELLDHFLAGDVIVHELRIVEGWTFAQALEAIRADPKIKQTLAQATPDEIMTAIGHPGEAAEGRFFPDTYRFSMGTTDVTLLREAYARMAKILAEEWAQRAADLPYASPDDALTMASIIEKETGAPVERAQIAGVFVRRLRLGMRLQTDPTVIYGLGSAFDGNLHVKDLRTDTPYNTYTRAGLPPTPIALPGRASLHAALHPDDGKALFFVSKGDGTHAFSETIEQHDAAVRRYQLKKTK
ncbi:endolytic transglycosylase MltG [Solimonas marina]|uniref:Endolytic murein transglycosylase n=1 Tax=Solimonas marina TaxID=2714601 RepID=A0A969WAV2_9GAMM|nr:endolytic transglycosylase MltG [Solimonas marina]NKF23129.1 endolytic transglycosylase MltG [Solimonas marina]